MPVLVIKLKETFANLISVLAKGWYSFTPLIRVMLAGIMTFLVIIIGFIGLLQYQLKQQPVPIIEVKPVDTQITSPKEVLPIKGEKQEIVIDSTEQAIAADAFDDDSAVIVTKREITQQEMFRVSNNWLLPQVDELKKRVKELKISVEKDQRYLDENAPSIDPLKSEIAKLEKDYQRNSAALDLPRLGSSSSFHDEIERRNDDIRFRLNEARKKLKVLEQVVASTDRRKTANEKAIPELEIELTNLNERLQKLYAFDAKILATTYQYATSGIKTLPLLRFVGNGYWNLGMLQELRISYKTRFQRDLPVTALGQSNTHTRMGWDHSNAADVGLHPGTLEGQWLVNYLKDQGIPFIAFRSAVPGHSTGPHVHVGLASRRLRR
ncbi:MAG: hypothetical protein HY819_00950 [Acidobacteria bacterium]|nr:hypothetical protein [Acidobacteriota bacterium]